MAEMQGDEQVLARIKTLVEEEHALLSSERRLDEGEHARAEALRVELDQCWDLLRQRRAKREFGEDPNEAKVRPARIVENYEQ
jgi:hypothetical protein